MFKVYQSANEICFTYSVGGKVVFRSRVYMRRETADGVRWV